MERKIHILGIAGSLRKDSFNRAILRAAAELAPKGVKVEIFGLEGIPPFNQDLEKQPAAKVTELKQKIRDADAILIATPEYNYSVPGVLKNAIDWASRPYGDNSLGGKPVAIMSASIGMFGGSRAQYHLRQILLGVNAHPLNFPEVMVGTAQDKIGPDGRVTDDKTREKIKELLEALVLWTRKIQK